MRFIARGMGIRYPAQERWAIRDVDLDILPGQVTWFTGALGSGTSTLLLALAGLAPRLTGGERRGTVMVDDMDAANISPLEHGIAYLGPSPALQLSGIAETVRDEIAVGPVNLGRSRVDSIQATADAMHRMHVDHLADRAPATLSGGETQRVLLASLLASAPRAWLLDEPFSALDHASTSHLQHLLTDLAVGGDTVLISCDDADAMVDLADRLIVMREGEVALDGDPDDLLRGDAILASGAGTTDVATLAREAGFAAPRPIRRADLLPQLAGTHRRSGD